MKPRIYFDTSIFGECFDKEFDAMPLFQIFKLNATKKR